MKPQYFEPRPPQRVFHSHTVTVDCGAASYCFYDIAGCVFTVENTSNISFVNNNVHYIFFYTKCQYISRFFFMIYRFSKIRNKKTAKHICFYRFFTIFLKNS